MGPSGHLIYTEFLPDPWLRLNRSHAESAGFRAIEATLDRLAILNARLADATSRTRSGGGQPFGAKGRS